MIGRMLVESVSVAALIVVLVCAVIRPFRWPEAVFAVPCAVLVAVCGATPFDHVRQEAERLGPVIGFLAAVLVLAKLCDDEGLFHACGTWMARWAHRRPRRLLGVVFALASVITAALSLDATVVLLTPVVFATAARMGARPKPHVYASAHLSNTASLLLPVSNLTNLLAFTASGLTFSRHGRTVVGVGVIGVLPSRGSSSGWPRGGTGGRSRLRAAPARRG
nr:SLC13 family permease [Streptomyces sp. SA15]